MDAERERQVHDLAHGLWTSAGRPSGKSLDHWAMAEQMVQELYRYAERTSGQRR